VSGWQYDASEEEERAATLLREKGWTVSTPPCPDCHGFGTITDSWSYGTPPMASGGITSKPCPRGCRSYWYFSTNAGGIYT
jgi:hypothetical protein